MISVGESVVLTQRPQHDVGHTVVVTEHGVLRLSFSISVMFRKKLYSHSSYHFRGGIFLNEDSHN